MSKSELEENRIAKRRPNVFANAKPNAAPMVIPNHVAINAEAIGKIPPAIVLTKLDGIGSRISELNNATTAQNAVVGETEPLIHELSQFSICS